MNTNEQEEELTLISDNTKEPTFTINFEKNGLPPLDSRIRRFVGDYSKFEDLLNE